MIVSMNGQRRYLPDCHLNVPQDSRDRRTKLQGPAAEDLVSDAQTSRGQQILDVW
jgi:hypothetical protein